MADKLHLLVAVTIGEHTDFAEVDLPREAAIECARNTAGDLAETLLAIDAPEDEPSK